jgi:hypothetical protein
MCALEQSRIGKLRAPQLIGAPRAGGQIRFGQRELARSLASTPVSRVTINSPLPCPIMGGNLIPGNCVFR